MTLSEIIAESTNWIPYMIGCSIGLSFFFWKRLPQSFQILSFYLIWNLVIEVLAGIVMTNEINNLPLLHIYTLLELVIFTLFYWKVGIFHRWGTRNMWYLIAGISALIILNSIFLQSIFTHNAYAKTMVQVMLIVYAIAYIFQLNEKTEEVAALNLANAAILIYYSASLFIFMAANFIVAANLGNLLWEANVIFNIIFHILIFISIWKASRARKLSF